MTNIKETLLIRGCPPNQVDTIVQKIENLSEQLKPAMSDWLKNESMPEVEVGGFTSEGLMTRFKGMQYPAAIFLLDWLIKEPDKAKKSIEKGIR